MTSQWVVAAANIILAVGTVFLGWQARNEAKAVSGESSQVAAQVDLERQQIEAANRPVVVPTSPDGWSDGSGAYGGDLWARVLAVKNTGPGTALNVRGKVDLGPPLGVWFELVPSNLGPGDEQGIRFNLASQPRAELTDWRNATGHLWCEDITGATWETEFGIYVEGQHHHRYINVRSMKMIKRVDGTVIA